VIGEGNAFDKIADEVRFAVIDCDLVKRDDRRKAKLGDRAGFAQETFHVLQVGADVARTRNLDGDEAVEFSVAGLEDRAKRAFTKQRGDSNLPRRCAGAAGSWFCMGRS